MSSFMIRLAYICRNRPIHRGYRPRKNGGSGRRQSAELRLPQRSAAKSRLSLWNENSGVAYRRHVVLDNSSYNSEFPKPRLFAGILT